MSPFKIRYIRQRDKFSCFPIAVGNALKYYGYSFSYRKEQNILKEIFGTNKDEGGTPWASLKKLKTNDHFKVKKRMENIRFYDLDIHLIKGGTAILTTSRDGTGYHSFFVFHTNNKYYGVNIFSSTISELSPSFLLDRLRRYNHGILLEKSCSI